MPAGSALSRAIDRLVRDLTRLAEDVVSHEVKRAIVGATAQRAKARPQRQTRSPALSPESRREAARLKAEQSAERKQLRAAERQQRKEELARLKQERAAARAAARNARLEAKDQVRREKMALREAEVKAREDARAAALAPPPVVVFKRARDGQVTMLKPRPVAAEGTPPPVA
jgi:hypothetical protein